MNFLIARSYIIPISFASQCRHTDSSNINFGYAKRLGLVEF